MTHAELNNLTMLKTVTLIFLLAAIPVVGAFGQAAQPSSERVEGLLIGSLIGDAAGGPHEFQRRGSMHPAVDGALSRQSISALGNSFELIGYTRPAEPYAHWTDNASPGTVTDDSRFKILFFRSFRDKQVTRESFATEILSWHADTTGRYGNLPSLWLNEFAGPARWVLGMTEEEGALPPERAWGGIPTMAGQMPFLPIAALHPADPEAAYRAVWAVDFLDNGIGRDLNAALVAGLAAALAPGASWTSVETAMRETDPFRYGQVPWVSRSVDKWLDFSHDAVSRAARTPSRLFRILEAELDAETWWEAWVPMTVVFSCAELAGYDPFATMQLILEFGHDTDSYLQVAGAFFGALHGASIFPSDMRATVQQRLLADYGVEFSDWLQHLGPGGGESRRSSRRRSVSGW